MADNDNLSTSEGLADVLSSIMKDPQTMETLSGILGPVAEEKQANNSPAASGIGDVLSDPALMAKLPEVIAALRPMMGSPPKKEAPQKDGEPKANNKRLALLYALKPYLSPRRCEAIDYFARMSKMGDIIKNIKL